MVVVSTAKVPLAPAAGLIMPVRVKRTLLAPVADALPSPWRVMVTVFGPVAPVGLTVAVKVAPVPNPTSVASSTPRVAAV